MCTRLQWYAIGYTVPRTELAFPNEPTPNVPIFRKARIVYRFSYRVPERIAIHDPCDYGENITVKTCQLSWVHTK
ncbi:hypothetical protein HanPI659440_Chr09g0348581 [Helianthus annuus]|nr:hypothetical protein HanPI659440_Chr09g0348581 [Helianthus annuus]